MYLILIRCVSAHRTTIHEHGVHSYDATPMYVHLPLQTPVLVQLCLITYRTSYRTSYRTNPLLSPTTCRPTRLSLHASEYWIHAKCIIGHLRTLFGDVQWSTRSRSTNASCGYLRKPVCGTCFLRKIINRTQIPPAITGDLTEMVGNMIFFCWNFTLSTVSTRELPCKPDNQTTTVNVTTYWSECSGMFNTLKLVKKLRES